MVAADSTTQPIAVIVECYPRLDAPQLAEELLGLEARGLRFEIWSLKRPRIGKLHPAQAELSARVRYLPDSVSADPVRVLGAMAGALVSPGGTAAFGAWLSAVMAAKTPGVFGDFGAAAIGRAEGAAAMPLIYAVGLDRPATVARLVAMMRQVPWGVYVGEGDLARLGEDGSARQLADAAFCLAGSERAARHLRPIAPGGEALRVAHTAIDLSRFTPPTEDAAPRTGEAREMPLRLVSIGKLQADRGYLDLMTALADMPKAIHWRLVHIGQGEEEPAVRQHALNLGLGPRVRWRGACDQTEVLAALRDADIYVQAPRPEGPTHHDLPRALLEAASQRLPIVTTRSPAAADFVVADENALVVRNGQAAVLTDAILRLARDPGERARLGGNGRLKVEATRSLGPVLDTLADRLRRAVAA